MSDEKQRERQRAYRARHAAELREKDRLRRGSPERKAADQRYHQKGGSELLARKREQRAERIGPPVPMYWPYSQSGWPVDVVNEAVPKHIPEDIRADVCQEMCLLLHERDDVGQDEWDRAYKAALRRTYGNWALRLDWRREDGLILADRFGGDE